MRYASGFAVPDPFILVETAKRYLLLSSLEYGRARKFYKGKRGYEVVLLDPYYEAVKKQMKGKVRKGSVLALIAAKFLKDKKIRKVTMPAQSWAIHVEQLRKAGIKVEIAKKPLYPQRAVKTQQELKEIKNVRNATVKAMNHCISILSKSKGKTLKYKGKTVTSEFLRKEARKILLEYDCEAAEMIISHGKQTAFPHDMGSGTIKRGEPVVMDFFPRSTKTGYWFDMTRTVCKGTPSKELVKLYNTVKKSQDAALKKVKAGVSTGAIHKAAADVFEQAGYTTDDGQGFIHGTGHGLGLEIHEAPSLHAKGTEKLRKGMIITIEPGLYYKKLGGVRLENTVRVTTTGYEDLTRMGRVLRL